MFIKFEEVYDNPHYKKHLIKKFRELKIGLEFFNTLYSEFIKLAAKLEFTKKILQPKFLHKLSFSIENQINFGL